MNLRKDINKVKQIYMVIGQIKIINIINILKNKQNIYMINQ